MTKDEALKLALEALDTASHGLYKATPHFDTHKMIEQVEASITAIKQALAAPVQEPVELKPCWYESKEKTMCRKCGQVHAEAIPPAAQRQWVGLTLEDKEEFLALDIGGSRLDAMDWAARKLKEKNHG